MRASSPESLPAAFLAALRPASSHASEADHAACRAAIRAGSRSFYAAAHLLPPRVRRAAYGLYAFCRLSDDLVDDAEAGAAPGAVLRLDARLARIHAGHPADHAADRALADVVADHAIPQALPAALLEGLAWDSEGRRYATLSALCAYAARVAASVGATMTLIMGVRDADVLARACDLGVAMQLTNIARDIGEDARAGRLYLPLDWLDEAGIDPDAFLAEPVATDALRDVVARLLAAADVLYARSEAGISSLPLACRPAIRAARLIYAEIGAEIARNGFDSVTRRARVGAGRKLQLLARAALPLGGGTERDAPSLPETAYLIEAVPTRTPLARPWWDIPGQAVRVLEMIEALREREATGREPA
jgi:phytoene synthase